MRRQLVTIAALAAIAVPLTGCQETVPTDGSTSSATSTATQEQQGGTEQSSDPTRSAGSGSSSSSTSDDQAGGASSIREVDFGNMTWPVYATEGDLPSTVTLKDGRASFDGGAAYRNGRAMLSTKDAASAGTPFAKTIYSDLDGDGDTDAIVGLHLDHGNGYSDYATVWLWENGKARAIGNVASTGRCGDKVTSIEVHTGRNILSARQLRGESDACGGELTGPEIADSYQVQGGRLKLTQPGSVG